MALIEDDQRIRAALVRSLAERGHTVRAAGRAMEGLTHVLEWHPDVVVLDLGLPDLDGTELLKMIRAVSAVPVIVATARDDEAEMVRMLDRGADDYVTKPFSADQLDARIRAVLRRAQSAPEPERIELGGLVIDRSTRVAELEGEALELSRRESSMASPSSSATRVLRSITRPPSSMRSGSGAACARRRTARMRASSWSAENGLVT